MKRFLLTLLITGFATGLVAQTKPHSQPSNIENKASLKNWRETGYVQPADTTTAARLDNGSDPAQYWRVYNDRVLATDWFRISEYMSFYYWVGDTIVSQDNDINFRFKTGIRAKDSNGQWAVVDSTVNTEFTINVTTEGRGIIKVTGDYTIGTGPWGCLEVYGTSAAANDSTIVIIQYDGYDVKGR